jgi:DNA polymerase II small subunit/DNA polymerase delta subunit B
MTIEFKDYESFLLPTDLRTPWDVENWMQEDLRISDKMLDGKCSVPYAYTMRLADTHKRLMFRLVTEKRRACRKAYLSMFDCQVKMYRSCEFELRKQGLIENADCYRKARLESLHRILELRQFSKKGL